jgi:hypothetical protein
VLSFSASPNVFTPSSLILFPASTPEWRETSTNSAKQSKRAAMSARQSQQSQQSHSTQGSMDRASPQIDFEQSNQWSLVTHTLQQIQKRKSPTKPRLLTVHTQRQRSQRGVLLQSITQRLRSFIADSIFYRHTRVERSKHTFSKADPWATLSARISQQSHSIHGTGDRASPHSTFKWFSQWSSITRTSTKGIQKHQSPTESRLLTSQN